MTVDDKSIDPTSPDAAAQRPVEQLTFEEAMAELEAVVNRLEGGNEPLDASIALYERGAALKARCEAKLRDAELKVEKIVAEGGAASDTAPFEPK